VTKKAQRLLGQAFEPLWMGEEGDKSRELITMMLQQVRGYTPFSTAYCISIIYHIII
jgi:hypothetical protein